MTKKFYNISPPIIKYPLSCFIFFILYVTLEYNNWLLYIYARSLSSKYNKTILFWCKKFNKLVSINISLARKPTEEVDILLFHLSGKKKKSRFMIGFIILPHTSQRYLILSLKPWRMCTLCIILYKQGLSSR